MNDQNQQRLRFRGCLLGGAVGDALGAPVEFQSRDSIQREFGARGIRDYSPAYGGLGRFTDDTQMTLFTAEGLIRAWMGRSVGTIPDYIGSVSASYYRWLMTQDALVKILKQPLPGTDGWLLDEQVLFQRRAPGNTCLSALKEMTTYGEPADNWSKGCGGVMRVAPVGLFIDTSGSDRETSPITGVFDIAVEVAGLTHGHPTGKLASGALALMIAELRDGRCFREALAVARSALQGYESHEETLQALTQAEELADGDAPPHEAIAQIGEGWVAEEALAISVYACLNTSSFEEAVVMAVNHDGDSDSTGSIAGQIMGTLYGVAAIPERWLAPLELRETITEIADDLLDCPGWPTSDKDAATPESKALLTSVMKKYPPFTSR